MSSVNTYLSYQLIVRDMPKSIERVEKQPMVDRETKYYLENISKVKTIDEFVKDDRLFRYAMKAHGLEDMTYAKAFMVKAMKEGLSDPDSFANKLQDKRYAEFVTTYNFAKYGELATVYNKAQHEVPGNYIMQAEIAGLDPDSEYVRQETAYYRANIGKITSIEALMSNERLLTYSMAAYGLDSASEDMDYIEELLAGGVRDANSPANREEDKRYTAFVAAFDFEALGEGATTSTRAQQPSIDKYLRQTLEENAGEQNEGVRLALYFERKASTLTNFYQILADPALAEVVRTALSLPAQFSASDIDQQVKFFESKLDIEDFTDPKRLEKFLTRFTTMWEIENQTTTPQSLITTLFQPVEYGVSTDLLLSIQSMKR
ncbi:MAG: DUF1217 domain-containing protein [Rhizobiaceae bacterium]|nr:DUF1217 domain-containing protein [Rhizobiaceae bacterium]